MKATHRSKKGGYTLVELLVYIAILAFMMVVIITSFIGISRVYRKVKIEEVIHSNINTSVETIVREVRGAHSVDTANSVFGVDAGTLVLNTTDTLGQDTTVEFALDSGVISETDDGVYVGPITTSNVTVNALRFYRIDTGNSEAVRFYITLTAGSGEYQKTETFYDTVVLRGSYQNI